MARLLTRCLAALIPLLLAACANPYADAYQPVIPAARTLPVAADWKPEVRLLPSGSAEAESRALLRRGYVLIGTATFTGRDTARSDAETQARAVGAPVVLLSQEYQSTQRGVTPVQHPVMVPVTRTVTDRASGQSYRETVWTRTTVTRYEPYTYELYTLSATFWAPGQPGGLGAVVQEPSDDTRQKNKTNKGAEVFAVVTGSPAFAADLLPGDLITALDGQAVDTPQDFSARLPDLYGRQGVRIDLLRDGQPVRKTVNINPEVMCPPLQDGGPPQPCPPPPPVPPAAPPPSDPAQ